MSKLRAAAVLFSTAAILGACGAADQNGNQPDPDNPSTNPTPSTQQAGLLQSNLPRDTGNASGGDVAALVDGNNAFAFALYDVLRAGNGNFFYSPFSISEALAMTWTGARGQTDKEMASTLHFTLDQSRLHPAFNTLDLALHSRGQGAKGIDGKGFRLQLTNALWGQSGYTILQPFLDVLAQNYGAGLRVLDFGSDPEAARKIINDWVAQQTEDKIKDLLDKLDPNTRLVLTNTIYFNAAWSAVFPEKNTTNGAFHRLDGSLVNVPMMSNLQTFPYAEGTGWKAVELPYDGKELSMLVLVPDAGQFEQVESKLGSEGLANVVGALRSSDVLLDLPKWKSNSKFKMKDTLKQMGMVAPFDSVTAEFSGINGGIEQLWIADVIHQSFVSVDEKGTEAAAATAVEMVGYGPSQPIHLSVDRPFIYVIRDNATGSILFAGRVIDPTAG